MCSHFKVLQDSYGDHVQHFKVLQDSYGDHVQHFKLRGPCAALQGAPGQVRTVPLSLSLTPPLSPSSYGDHVQHFKVLQDRSGQYFVWEEMFFSLNQMVEFYHSNSIAKEETVFYGDPEHPASPGPPLQHPHHAHALFDFTPHHPSQLRFLRGDFIDLLDCSDSLRWRGRCHGRVGFFPPEYVQAVYQ
ncbi:GRB2-related adapter protein-like [Oncorhynchus kisutch]|uniref:GRB2-related adapter protein-like n=1 Tax=Oncorhynchus kisutch TaxID=8019 RepID=UPI0012DDA778|nr:GRB2-related adapter protein-like [Oncorhynchus kisutch]